MCGQDRKQACVDCAYRTCLLLLRSVFLQQRLISTLQVYVVRHRADTCQMRWQLFSVPTSVWNTSRCLSPSNTVQYIARTPLSRQWHNTMGLINKTSSSSHMLLVAGHPPIVRPQAFSWLRWSHFGLPCLPVPSALCMEVRGSLLASQ